MLHSHHRREVLSVKLLTLSIAGVLVAFAVLAVACSDNDAESFMPKASEVCCGDWNVLGDEEQGACSSHLKELIFPEATGCWYRVSYNENNQPGDPEDLEVYIGVMESPAAAARWLVSYSPTSQDIFDYVEDSPFDVGDESRRWSATGTRFAYAQTDFAFRRNDVGVLVLVGRGDPLTHEAIAASVDQAILARMDETPDATPTLTATEILASEDVRDVFAELINIDASLLGESWTPDWTCQGIARALRIEAGVVSLAGADAADDPAAARAQDTAFGTMLLFEDWLFENDC